MSDATALYEYAAGYARLIGYAFQSDLGYFARTRHAGGRDPIDHTKFPPLPITGLSTY